MTEPDTAWYGRLDRPTIVAAALRIAARPGVTQVRFRDLGEELGADPTAVYRHFRSKSELLAAVTDALMSEILEALPRDAGWRPTLEAMASETLAVFARHPAIGAHLADPRPVGPGELDLVEASLLVFERAGLPSDRVVEHYGAFAGLLLSYVATACREIVATPARAGVEDIPWLAEPIAVSADTHPALARHSEQIAAMDYRSTYLSGVRVLLAAIEAAATPPVPRPPAPVNH